VKEKAQVKLNSDKFKSQTWSSPPHAYSQISEDQCEAFADIELIVKSNI